SAVDARGSGISLAGTAVTYDAGAGALLRAKGSAKFVSASSSTLTVATGGVTGTHAPTLVAVARADAAPSTYSSIPFFGRAYPAGLPAAGCGGSTNGTSSYWFGRDGAGTPAGGPTEDTQPKLIIKRFAAGAVDAWVSGEHVVRASSDGSYNVSAGLG